MLRGIIMRWIYLPFKHVNLSMQKTKQNKSKTTPIELKPVIAQAVIYPLTSPESSSSSTPPYRHYL